MHSYIFSCLCFISSTWTALCSKRMSWLLDKRCWHSHHNRTLLFTKTQQRGAWGARWRIPAIHVLIWTGGPLLLLELWCQHTLGWVQACNTFGCGGKQTRLFLWVSPQWATLSCDTRTIFSFWLSTLWMVAYASQSWNENRQKPF